MRRKFAPLPNRAQGSHTSLANLGDLANAAHHEAIDSVQNAVQRAIACGGFLLEAKEQCDHGAWLDWLSKDCPDISPRSAQAYMKVARRCLSSPSDAAELHGLTLDGALRKLSSPKPKAQLPADLPRWAGDDAAWLPEGTDLLLADIDERTIAVQQSGAHRGHYHILCMSNLRNPSAGPFIVEGSPKPMKAGVAPGLLGRVCRRYAGIGPDEIDWIVTRDADSAELDELVAELLPWRELAGLAARPATSAATPMACSRCDGEGCGHCRPWERS